MQKTIRTVVGVAVLSALAVGCASYQSKPKYSVEDVMKQGFKGDTSLIKKVLDGKGGADDFKLLVELTGALAKNQPPKGDAASWAEKTKALATAASDVAAGKPGALDTLKGAANCKACHSVHKPG